MSPADSTQAAAPAPTAQALAIAAAALAAALFLGMDAIAKTLSARYDAVQLSFFRFAAGACFSVPLWLWFRSPLPARGQWRVHALRAGLLLVALMTWFYALSVLPLLQAVAVGYTAPLFIALLAMLLLGERPSRWIWLALLCGVVGVSLSLWPELEAWRADPVGAAGGTRLLGLGAAAVSALCYAGSIVVSRHQARTDALWTILVVQNVLPMLLMLPPTALRWQPLLTSDLLALFWLGLLATCGLLAITWALTHLEASKAAPVEYTGLAWAALLGYAFFDEVPTALTLASALLIIGGCLLLLRR